jgi:hypothetical protein
MTSPLRGPKSPEGGGFAAAHLLARRAGYGAAPPAPRLLRIACGDGLRPALTPETTAAPGARKSGQAQARPALRAARKPRGGRPQDQAGRQDTAELAFDSQKEAENYKPRVVSRIK